MNVITLDDARIARNNLTLSNATLEVVDDDRDSCSIAIQPSSIKPVTLNGKQARRLAQAIRRIDNKNEGHFLIRLGEETVVSLTGGAPNTVSIRQYSNTAICRIPGRYAGHIVDTLLASVCVRQLSDAEERHRDTMYRMSVTNLPPAKLLPQFCDATKRMHLFISGEGPFPLTLNEASDLAFKLHMLGAYGGRRPRSVRNDLFSLVLRPRLSGMLLEVKFQAKLLEYHITESQLKISAKKINKLSRRPCRNGEWT